MTAHWEASYQPVKSSLWGRVKCNSRSATPTNFVEKVSYRYILSFQRHISHWSCLPVVNRYWQFLFSDSWKCIDCWIFFSFLPYRPARTKKKSQDARALATKFYRANFLLFKSLGPLCLSPGILENIHVTGEYQKVRQYCRAFPVVCVFHFRNKW